MELIFLDAGIPLTKTFSLSHDGTLEKSAYPLVKNFTSYREKVNTAAEFCDVVKSHALAGRCLLKGLIKRDLKEESRAGSTEPLQATLWSVFDLDNVDGIESIADFVRDVLPVAFHDVDYVVQYSASSGVSSNTGVNAHLFFLHDTAFTPEQAKLFITELNLTHATLSKQLELTAAGTALRYRLDRSVVQSDKLIYIAPPVLGNGVTSSLDMASRIHVVPGAKRLVTFDWKTASPPAAIEAALQTKVDSLREAMGLRRKVAKYRTVRGGEVVLSNPDRANVTGERIARGFTYLNINGGDSWGYYYASDNPRYLRNFKGEPTVVLADFLPEYWAHVQERLVGKRQRRPFAFRHRPTDAIWNGVYDPINDRIEDLAQTSKANLPDFFGQYNVDAPAVLEDWNLAFDPTRLVQVDFEEGFCNKWAPTPYMTANHMPCDAVPKTIQRVLRHVLAHDEQCYAHFMNWLAFIFQRREKTGTAWVISGRQGTGKGVLFSQILTPLFGDKYCIQKQLGSLEDQFNAELETAIIYNFDEGQVIDSPKTRQAYARFKNMITEPTCDIRAMRQNAVKLRSFTNFIVTSNDYDAIGIEDTDRRFNVAPRQEEKIVITSDDIDAIGYELDAFASYLAAYQVNELQARTALNNDAKMRMREASQDWLEQMCEAVRNSNIGYFTQFHESSAPSGGNLMAWSSFNAVVQRFSDAIGRPSVVTASDLSTIYMYLSGNVAAPGKFTRMLAHKNLVAGSHHDSLKNKTVRGYPVTWVGEALPSAKQVAAQAAA